MVRILSLLFLALPAIGSAQLMDIGAAAAVRGGVQAMAPTPGAVGRILQGGNPLYHNDKVKTETEAQLQILLLDETVFTVGPHTELALDEYVYDPKTSVGKVTANVTQGVFRFVSGKIAKKDHAAMKVKVPVGVIGIRGTDVAGIVRPSGTTTIILKAGEVSFVNPYGVAVLDTPGDSLTVEPGKAPSKPRKASKALLAELNAALAPPLPHAQSPVQPGQASPSDPGAKAAPLPDLDSVTALASQDIAIGSRGTTPADWDDLRNIQTGAVQYTGSGGYTCAGGACGAGGSGTISLTLDVDFGARTYGSSCPPCSSIISLGGTLADSSPIVSALDTPISYAAGTGAAVITLASPANSSNPAFDGTTIAFQNSGATQAASASVSLGYTSGGATASGSAAISRP